MEFDFKNIDIVGVISGLSTKKATVTRRHSHTFIYKIDGESTYYLRGKEYRLAPGTLLYVPENETYSFQKITPGDSRYCLVNFHAYVKTEKAPELFTNLGGVNALQIFQQMERSLVLGQEAGYLECQAMFYSFLASLARNVELPYTTSAQKTQIEPAIRYMEENLFNSDFKISGLAELCGMSAPTFRRIFISKYSTTPKNYLIEKRLRYAEQILKSGEYGSIRQVASMVGFDDPLYFSKCYREFFGAPPTRWNG